MLDLCHRKINIAIHVFCYNSYIFLQVCEICKRFKIFFCLFDSIIFPMCMCVYVSHTYVCVYDAYVYDAYVYDAYVYLIV